MMKHKHILVLMLLAGIWTDAAMAQESGDAVTQAGIKQNTRGQANAEAGENAVHLKQGENLSIQASAPIMAGTQTAQADSVQKFDVQPQVRLKPEAEMKVSEQANSEAAAQVKQHADTTVETQPNLTEKNIAEADATAGKAAAKQVNQKDIKKAAGMQLTEGSKLADSQTVSQEMQVEHSVKDWAKAWSSKNVNDYMAAYVPGFKPEGMRHDAWEKQRFDRIAKPRLIEVRLSDIKLSMQDDDHATASFTQNYRSDSYREQTEKTLHMVRVSDRWLIDKELTGRAAKIGAYAKTALTSESGAQPKTAQKVDIQPQLEMASALQPQAEKKSAVPESGVGEKVAAQVGAGSNAQTGEPAAGKSQAGQVQVGSKNVARPHLSSQPASGGAGSAKTEKKISLEDEVNGLMEIGEATSAVKPDQNKKILTTEQTVANAKAKEQAAIKAKQAGEIRAAKLKAEKFNVLLDVVQKAVLKNPEVLSRWDTFKAAVKEADTARGAYLPRVDLSVDKGRERYQAGPTDPSYMGRRGLTLSLTQMLYDGFTTRNEIRRLTNAELSRYYDLLDASETAALDAIRQYYDVSRFRELLDLTEDNYVLHRTVLEQIRQKVEAGVSRRVDLDQVVGRLALSQSNLTLDNANIHDVNARFQRAVGELPPPRINNSASKATQKKLQDLILRNAADAVLSVGIEFHPAILAAVENVRSARYDLQERWAKYQPNVNLHVSQSKNFNYTGIPGATNDAVAEVVVTWNLFNGGADRARSGQYANRLDAARDQRDKTCRDVRMNLAIAYNDVWKITEQLGFLNQHQLAIEKARGAYQKQFEIGQRSLLDVLDSENELYQAKRSYVNAEYDLLIAQARTLAGMGRLVSSLGLSNLDTPDLPELLGSSSDGAEHCPPEPPLPGVIPMDDLNARALEAAKPPERPAETDDLSASGVPEYPGLPVPGSKADADAKAEAEADQFLMSPSEIKAAKLKAGKKAKAGK